MLDFDMLASPNYVRFVYDGDNSAGNNNVPGPPGSGANGVERSTQRRAAAAHRPDRIGGYWTR